jgi:8-oxo-dGTP pyrophosphatase MutT (NUDIX family)
LTAAELRTRILDATRAGLPIGIADRSDVARDPREVVPLAAAVLVPFVLAAAPAILLTKRNTQLKTHPGQVSFPGGRIEPTDTSPEQAALREAAEEIALDPARVELAGRMADYLTGTGFRITPILGFVPPGLELRPSPDEVEAVFELPIAMLLEPHRPERRRMDVGGRIREFWVWPHPVHHIWGATAAILVNVSRMLQA